MPLATDNPQLDLQMKVAVWREKARAGTLTLEETREAVQALRAGRSLIAAATGGSKANASRAKAKPSGDDLLSELEGL